MSLRNWQIKGNFKASEPFMYPAPKETFDPVGLDKPTFGESHDLKIGNIARRSQETKKGQTKYIKYDAGSRYTNKFKERNINEIRALSTRQSNVPTLAWTTTLRGAAFDKYRPSRKQMEENNRTLTPNAKNRRKNL